MNARARLSPLPRRPGAWARRVRAPESEFLALIGWWPTLILVGAVGLVAVSLGMTSARFQSPGAEVFFWCGLLLIFSPIALRLALPGPSRFERYALIATLALGLYVIKLLHSPVAFTFYDELLHQRTAQDILASGRLFVDNPLLPTSPYYPGLENVTVALARLSGLPVFDTGALLLAAARLLLVLALMLLYEQISGSARVAGLGALVYITNPAFVYFDAQFAYETLALPLAVTLLWLEARRADAQLSTPHQRCWRVTMTVLLAGLVVTHHITVYFLLGLLVLWSVISLWDRWRARRHARASGQAPEPWRLGAGPEWLATLILVASLAWLYGVAQVTLSYLGGNFRSSLRELLAFLTGQSAGRRLFEGFAQDVAPAWERASGYLAVLLLGLGLLVGLWQVWFRHRRRPALWVMAIAALAYPATQLLRVTPFGLQLASRTPEFLFVPLGLVVAVGVTERWLERARGWVPPAALALLLSVVMVGGVILGWPRWARLPGPYRVAADTLSIEPQGLAAAYWAGEALGPGQRVAADRINALLMLAYGGQNPVTSSYSGVNVPELFFSESFGPGELAILQRGKIRYVVVDRRLSRELPLGGVYYESGERDARRHNPPIALERLEKYDALEGAYRIYDSGDITIYDVGAISHAP
jgi:hypothetical protein